MGVEGEECSKDQAGPRLTPTLATRRGSGGRTRHGEHADEASGHVVVRESRPEVVSDQEYHPLLTAAVPTRNRPRPDGGRGNRGCRTRWPSGRRHQEKRTGIEIEQPRHDEIDAEGEEEDDASLIEQSATERAFVVRDDLGTIGTQRDPTHSGTESMSGSNSCSRISVDPEVCSITLCSLQSRSGPNDTGGARLAQSECSLRPEMRWRRTTTPPRNARLPRSEVRSFR